MGDCWIRPLKSTRKRARDKKRLHTGLEAKKHRTHPASDSSSDKEDCFHRQVDDHHANHPYFKTLETIILMQIGLAALDHFCSHSILMGRGISPSIRGVLAKRSPHTPLFL